MSTSIVALITSEDLIYECFPHTGPQYGRNMSHIVTSMAWNTTITYLVGLVCIYLLADAATWVTDTESLKISNKCMRVHICYILLIRLESILAQECKWYCNANDIYGLWFCVKKALGCRLQGNNVYGIFSRSGNRQVNNFL